MSELPEQRGSLRFALLGPLRAWRDDTELELGPRQQRLALALLLLRNGGLVEFSDFRHLIWDDASPPTAVNMVHRYVGTLRRLLEPDLPPRSNGRWLVRKTGGYRFVRGNAELDLCAFRDLVNQARHVIGTGDDNGALDLYLSAMSLSRGRCAAGLGAAAEAHPEFIAIDRECAEAAREAARVALRCGRSAQILPALREAALRNPLDEKLQAELLLVLSADGKQAESIALFGEIRSRLAEDLGVDPGPELRSAYESIIGQADTGRPGARTGSLVPPAQLPPDLRFFTGRASLLHDTVSLIQSGQPAPPIFSFDGMPGVGKSALAVRLAHRVAADFPDGQLYADLHGFDSHGSGTDPSDTLHGFLSALGVSQEAIPYSLDIRSALFRSLVSGRRFLILLDNARDAAQVRPLLPGSAGNAVVVTSRSRLSSLAATHGAHLLHLDVPSLDEARAGFAERIGLRRAAAEPAALDEIIRRCGRLPLALAVVAARAVAHAHQPLSTLATDLRHMGRSLDAVDDAVLDQGIRAVFSWSYRLLGEHAARLFRALPLHPGPLVTISAAASLMGVPLPEARSHIAELLRTGLIDWQDPAGYRLHDLVRVYALELSSVHDTGDDQEAARRRLLHHYLETAYAANCRLRPLYEPVPAPTPMPGVTPQYLPDENAVMTWSANERHALRSVIWSAAEREESGAAFQLVMYVRDLFQRHGWEQEWAGLLTSVRAASPRTDAVGNKVPAYPGRGAQ
ncbi:AfsR/SARP family transcriptional regulator [Streptomyces sp. NPDC002755]